MKKVFIIMVMCLAGWIAVDNPFVNEYLPFTKGSAVPAAKKSDPLYQSIIKNAPTYEIPPKDATIDKVWKAIPGYNGREVDIAASYKNMKNKGIFNEKKLIFTETKPKIHLKD